MLKQTLSSGINADYVLIDTWFTTEPFIQKTNALGLDAIGMVKQLRQRYEYNGRLLNLRKLFSGNSQQKAWRHHLFCHSENEERNNLQNCFIRNRNCKRDYLAILSTDISLDDCEIVRLYARK